MTNLREVACGPGDHDIGRRAKGSHLGRAFRDAASSEGTQDGPVGSSVKSKRDVPPGTRVMEERRPEFHDTAAPRDRCTIPSCGPNSSSPHTPKAHRGKLLRASEVPISWRHGLSPIPDPATQITLSTSIDEKERGEKERGEKERDEKERDGKERDSRKVEGNRAHGCNTLGKVRENRGRALGALVFADVWPVRFLTSHSLHLHMHLFRDMAGTRRVIYLPISRFPGGKHQAWLDWLLSMCTSYCADWCQA